MDIKDLIEELAYTPRKKASTHGGEYSSPCPFCKDGDDRFLIWPQRSNSNGEYQGGRYSCRVCGKYGNAITFLCDFHGLGYKEACAQLRIAPKRHLGIERKRSGPKFSIAEEPSNTWKEKAFSFVNWCHEKLMKNSTALSHLTAQRGLNLETINRFKVGINPGEFGRDIFRERETWGLLPDKKEDGTSKKFWLPKGIVIPTFGIGGSVSKVKVRRTAWKEGDKLPKYVELSGSKSCHSIYGDTSLDVGFVIESELDAILVQQFASDLVYCIALGGSTKPLDIHTNELLKKTPIIFFCPDFDEAGALAWVRWKKMFPGIHRILTPDGKSAGDAYLAGVDLREWIMANLTEIRRKSKKT